MTTLAQPSGVLRWTGGAVVSVLAHGVVLGGLALALRPTLPPDPPAPDLAVQVRPERVARTTAEAVAATGAAAPAATATGARSAGASLPMERATAVSAASPPVPPVPPAAPQVATAAPGPVLPTLAPGAAAAPLTAASPPRPVAATAAQAPRLAASPPAAGAALAPAPPPSGAARVPPGAPMLEQARPDAPRLQQTLPDAPTAPALALPAERQTAMLAPDAAALVAPEVLAAFLQPGDLRPGDAGVVAVRDGLAALLAQFPCARIQSQFNTETGSLDLRGHVPDPAMQPVLVAALQAQLGTGLPVTGALRILPRPQCGVLAAIEALGLPQSSEQFTNPRVIGPDAQVRDYSFVAGDRLELDLTAPDYPAHILVDYFDAQGQVLHLQPNAHVPDRVFAPAAQVTIGRASPGNPALEITVAPPFGQEIAVALASSAPLFDPGRPLAEPAGPYLADLARRIAAARAADPDFRGEWVYFLVTTAER